MCMDETYVNSRRISKMIKNYAFKPFDESNCYRAAYTLFFKLQKAEERASKEGWIDADDLEKELG